MLSGVSPNTSSPEILTISVPPIVASDIPVTSTPILSGQTVTGTINGQADAYALQGVGGGSIVVSMGGLNQNVLESHIEVLDPNGNSVGSATRPAGEAGHVVTLTVATPSSGTYYIIATSDDASTGNYGLTAAAVPGVQSTGTMITSGQELTGTIDANLDIYTFHANAGATILGSVGESGSNNFVDLRMQIFDPKGKQIGDGHSNFSGSTGTVLTTATSTGTYYYVISSKDGIRGSYKAGIATSGAQANAPVANGATVAGSLNGDVDVYPIGAVAGGSIVAGFGGTNNPDNLEITARLFDPNGNVVASADSAFNNANGTLTYTGTTAGQYFIALTSKTGNKGAYNFAATAVNGTQVTDSDGGPVANGATISGNIDGDLDVFTFTATAGGSIVASMASTPENQFLGSKIQIFDNGGHLLGTGVNTFNGQIATLTVTAPTSGTYYMVLSSSNGNSGNYKASVASLPGFVVTDSDGGPVSSGQLINGSLDGDLDIFTIQGTAGGNIMASMAGQNGGNFLVSRVQIFDPSGKQIANSASPFNNAFALAKAQATTTGTYYIVASSADGHRDNYKLSVASLPGAQAGGTITPGVTSGTLSGQLDSYSFAATAGATISASLIGSTPSDFLEAELYLFDSNGALVESARSPFDGFAAPITTKAPTTGTYYLVAASSGGNKGAYNLTLGVTPVAGAVISGEIYDDANGNGVLDSGEAGIPNATVYLDTNNNATLDVGETSTNTASGGFYTFNGQAAGSYNVRQILPTGYRQTAPATPVIAVTVAANAVSSGHNFGDTTLGLVTGNVFNDINSNGTKDGADAGLPGRTVYADLNNNNTQDAGEPFATTDASGNYALSVGPGTFILRNTLVAGTRKSAPTGLQIVTTGSGQIVPGKDFGVTTNILLAGTVYNDANGNGQQDFNEVGIPGVTVNIKTGPTIIASRVTDASGKYQVRGLGAGSGSVEIVLPGGTVAVNPATGTYVGSATSGQQLGNLNFGLKSAGPAPAPAFSSSILIGADSDSLLDELA